MKITISGNLKLLNNRRKLLKHLHNQPRILLFMIKKNFHFFKFRKTFICVSGNVYNILPHTLHLSLSYFESLFCLCFSFFHCFILRFSNISLSLLSLLSLSIYLYLSVYLSFYISISLYLFLFLSHTLYL